MIPEGLPKARLAVRPDSGHPHGAHELQESIIQTMFSHRSAQFRQLSVLPHASKLIAQSLPASIQPTAKQLQGRGGELLCAPRLHQK